MATPPPTETPAPLSEADIQLSIDWLRGLAGKGGKGVVGNIDARGLGHIAEQLSTLTARNEALGQLLAHIHLHLTIDDNFDSDELIADIKALDSGGWVNTESLLADSRRGVEELSRSLNAAERRNHDLAQDLEKADAVIAENESSLGWSRYAPTEWIEAAVARHKARAALATPAQDTKEKEDG